MKYVDSYSIFFTAEEISARIDQDSEILDSIVENTCNTWQKKEIRKKY